MSLKACEFSIQCIIPLGAPADVDTEMKQSMNLVYIWGDNIIFKNIFYLYNDFADVSFLRI